MDNCVVKRFGTNGISLLSVGGKILARVMLNRLLTHVAEVILPETQCGFRRGLSTIEMVFVARLLQEKCREQHRPLYVAFIDLSKAFDTIDRAILWKTLSIFGCPSIFLAILRDFHDDMSAQVIYGCSSSEFFPVQVGVRPGCVLAPVIFNIFMTAVALYARNSFLQDNGITVKYRLDGNLFNQRRLSAQSKTSVSHSYKLQYADDTALVSHTADGNSSMAWLIHTVVLVLLLILKRQKYYSSTLRQILLYLFSTSKTAPSPMWMSLYTWALS